MSPRILGPAEKVAGPLLRRIWRVAVSDKYLWVAARWLAMMRSDSHEVREQRVAHGFRMRLRLDRYPDGPMYYGVYEVCTSRLMRRLVRRGDRTIDVGGNIGYTTLELAMLTGASGEVRVFEPMPTTRRMLEDNIRLNGLSNVLVVPAGCAESAGEFEVYAFRDGEGEQHLLSSMKPLYETASPIRCQMVRLDDHVNGPIRLLKVDVEGAEVGVIRGSRELIRNSHPHIIIENNRETLRAFGHRFADIHRAVMDAWDGYELRAIDGWGHRRVSDAAVEADRLKSNTNYWYRPVSQP